ncbi:sugar ABC transporter ATP-binding protein [Sediminispirochaeta smaragdinae]|uniref:ABC transporter related protein n=1 Tax=Sediminispirochaeta smaragdinae (strain DSM 11293 / JCM 15392 / SEBR 4228) TaxID=573413 RepID=E1R4P3_SEDSS|nr:sugar ABC transporter ATP-binding protein [Sediminispirochaeta smaragdinae]ADK82131.1 ABC transporter related protein [Sediminispirochaeta smaragdinae DSM 11293]
MQLADIFVPSGISAIKHGRDRQMKNNIIEMKNVTKVFPGVIALKDMSLEIEEGEIHGLIGENGAGKSTLIKTLTGADSQDKGEIYFDGRQVRFYSTIEAIDAGISCVYQELNIVTLLSVTDNIFIGKGVRNKIGLLDTKEMDRQAAKVLHSLGIDIDVRTECGKFGIGIQQMVEIAKCVLFNAKVIVMDEPTSSLGEQEVVQLFNTVRLLKDRGVSILFVSHKLEELFDLCDRVTVMRDGERILTERIENVDKDTLITAMVGRTIHSYYPKEETTKGDLAFKVDKLQSAGVLHDISFEAFRGQVLGFAGLVGAGRTETFRAIFGADPLDSGTIEILGEKVRIRQPKDAIYKGVAFLTEDRKSQGLVLSQPVWVNLALASMKKNSNGPFLDTTKIYEIVEKNIAELKIKTPTLMERVEQLSGGNQQKVVIGKWINTDAEIYIFDEPTRGIDVGAKVEVYNIINTLVAENKCVIIISSELPEILGICDRVIVMREGRITAEIERDSNQFNQESIMKAAWGGTL